MTPLRGLSVLAIPVAMSAGLWAAARRWREATLLGLCAAYALLACPWVVPKACYVRPIALAELDGVHVERCEFLWRAAPAAAAAPAPEQSPAVRLAGEASDGVVFVRRTPRGSELWRARLSDRTQRPLLEKPERQELWPFWSSAAGKLLFQVERTQAGAALLLLLDAAQRPRRAARAQPRLARALGDLVARRQARRLRLPVRCRSESETRHRRSRVASGTRRVVSPDTAGFVFFRPPSTLPTAGAC